MNVRESYSRALEQETLPARVSDEVDVDDAVEYGVVDGVVHVAEHVVVLRNDTFFNLVLYSFPMYTLGHPLSRDVL